MKIDFKLFAEGFGPQELVRQSPGIAIQVITAEDIHHR